MIEIWIISFLTDKFMYPCVSFVYLSLLSLSVLLFKIFNFRFHVFLTGLFPLFQGCQSFQLQISDKLKTYSPIFWSTEACWQISRFPINRNAERCINGAQDIFRVNKESDLITLTALSPTKCIPSITKELHLMDKVKTYSRLFRSTEDGWRISRLTIKLNADRSRIEAQYIIIVTK